MLTVFLVNLLGLREMLCWVVDPFCLSIHKLVEPPMCPIELVTVRNIRQHWSYIFVYESRIVSNIIEFLEYLSSLRRVLIGSLSRTYFQMSLAPRKDTQRASPL